MKFKIAFAAIAMAAGVSACAGSPASTTPAATPAPQAAAAPAPTNKNAVEATFATPLQQTHDAAVAALKLNGFDIKSETETLITGERPRKIGVFVGSGGEKISVTLTSLDATSTKASSDTQRTFVGGAGQKDWDAPVIEAMTQTLTAK
jgi:hypothetical protein